MTWRISESSHVRTLSVGCVLTREISNTSQTSTQSVAQQRSRGLLKSRNYNSPTACTHRIEQRPLPSGSTKVLSSSTRIDISKYCVRSFRCDSRSMVERSSFHSGYYDNLGRRGPGREPRGTLKSMKAGRPTNTTKATQLRGLVIPASRD
jgi:hypothetical protein